MKNLLMVVLTIVLLSNICFAQIDSVTLSTDFTTGQTDSSGYKGNKDPGIESSIIATFGDLFGSVESSNGLENSDADSVGFTLGGKGEFYDSSLVFGGSASVWLDKNSDTDMFVPSFWIDIFGRLTDNTDLTIHTKVSVPIPIAGDKGGLYGYLGFFANTSLSESLSLTYGPELVINTGVYEEDDSGSVLNSKLFLNYAFTEALTFNVGTTWFTPIFGADDVDDLIFFSVGATYRF
tara:strand:+ start:294 stop:1001 length:708 start_codon:yes stop_codon:yes gene_type:complete